MNRVKEVCTSQGWTVEGSSSWRERKKGCGVVHFYRLNMKGGVMDLMARGVGVSKREAVWTAFKVMEDRLKEVLGPDCQIVETSEPDSLKKKDVFSDNIVNFHDEEPGPKNSRSRSSSEVSLTFPPCFMPRTGWQVTSWRWKDRED